MTKKYFGTIGTRGQTNNNRDDKKKNNSTNVQLNENEHIHNEEKKCEETIAEEEKFYVDR